VAAGEEEALVEKREVGSGGAKSGRIFSREENLI
jgi:hypothetical protein